MFLDQGEELRNEGRVIMSLNLTLTPDCVDSCIGVYGRIALKPKMSTSYGF